MLYLQSQATLAQSVEQRIRNAQVVSSSLMSGSNNAVDQFNRIFSWMDVYVTPLLPALVQELVQGPPVGRVELDHRRNGHAGTLAEALFQNIEF